MQLRFSDNKCEYVALKNAPPIDRVNAPLERQDTVEYLNFQEKNRAWNNLIDNI